MQLLFFLILFISTLSFGMSSDHQLVFKQDGELITGCGLKLTNEQGNRRNVLLSPSDIETCIEKFNVFKTTREYTRTWNKKNNLDFSNNEYLSYETWQHVIKPLCDCSDNTQKLEAFLNQYEHEDLQQLFLLMAHLGSSDLEKKVFSHLIQRLKQDPKWIKTYFQKAASENKDNVLSIISETVERQPELQLFVQDLIPLKIQSLYEKKQLCTEHKGCVHCITYRPDGKYLVSGGLDGIVVWDGESYQPVKQLTGHNGWVSCLTYSPDKNYLISGSEDKTIMIWDGESHQLIHQLIGHKDFVTCLAYRADGKYLASGSDDGIIIIWDGTSYQLLDQLTGHKDWVNCIAYRPDGKYLASGSTDKTIMIWDGESRQLVHQLTGHKDWVRCLTYRPDSKCLASGSDDGIIIIWDGESYQPIQQLIAHKKQLAQFRDHKNRVSDLVYSPDGTCLISGSIDKTIIIWKAKIEFKSNLEKALLSRYLVEYKNKIVPKSYGETIFNRFPDEQKKRLGSEKSTCPII